MNIDEFETSECTCHISPPCNFCISLDEDEIDAYLSGGRHGLFNFIWDRDVEKESEDGTAEKVGQEG